MKITIMGLDLAKSVFQAHGIDETGNTVLVKRLCRLAFNYDIAVPMISIGRRDT
ncbi:hypothetical protein [Sinorhizobium medicae]|uniref:hypothetical protein n=1 Tax=Sinorhizobium medicae TaxID=110321 RepID=UPI003B516E76